ncbi:uncharacterized protein V6R79_025641 [Siganus canaliculatus]
MAKFCKVIMNGLKAKKMAINLCNTKKERQKMTVQQLKEKLVERVPRFAGICCCLVGLIVPLLAFVCNVQWPAPCNLFSFLNSERQNDQNGQNSGWVWLMGVIIIIVGGLFIPKPVIQSALRWLRSKFWQALALVGLGLGFKQVVDHMRQRPNADPSTEDPCDPDSKDRTQCIQICLNLLMAILALLLSLLLWMVQAINDLTTALSSKENKTYQVVVIGLREGEMIIDLCNTEEQMQKMTVLQLKEKIIQRVPGHDVQYYGLYNQGETSYLNSVLQVLFRTEDFREAVERHYHENTARGNCLDCRLQSLFDELKRKTTETHSITKCLGIDRVNEQQDAAEYFEKILSLTSPDVSQVNGIEDYFREKHFRGENQLYCNSCHAKSDATIKRVIKNHPEVLMLLLKRFTFDYKYMQYIKINSDVIVPGTLQIPENQTYELYAVVDYFGSLRGGHYTATINVNGEWYTFNDSSVTKVRLIILNCSAESQSYIQSSSAYLLFYKKTKEIPPSGPSLNPTAEDEPVSTDPADRRPPRTGMISKIVGAIRYLVGASADIVKEEPGTPSTGQDLPLASSDTQASSGKVSTAQDELSSGSSAAQKSPQISAPTSDIEDEDRVDSTSKQDETSDTQASSGKVSTAQDELSSGSSAAQKSPQISAPTSDIEDEDRDDSTSKQDETSDLVGASADSVKEEPGTPSTGQDLPLASSDTQASSGKVSTAQDELSSGSSAAQKSPQISAPTSDIEDEDRVDSTSKQDETSASRPGEFFM